MFNIAVAATCLTSQHWCRRLNIPLQGHRGSRVDDVAQACQGGAGPHLSLAQRKRGDGFRCAQRHARVVPSPASHSVRPFVFLFLLFFSFPSVCFHSLSSVFVSIPLSFLHFVFPLSSVPSWHSVMRTQHNSCSTSFLHQTPAKIAPRAHQRHILHPQALQILHLPQFVSTWAILPVVHAQRLVLDAGIHRLPA